MPTARALYAESLALYREQGDRLGIIEILEGFARLAGAQQQVLHAARLWGAAEAFREISAPPSRTMTGSALTPKWPPPARRSPPRPSGRRGRPGGG